MGSNGSVIPFFLSKKEEGVVPITDINMTRFNIPIQGGVDLVMHALEHAWGGEIFIPKIPSYSIMDLAKAVAPNSKKQVVGIRPGEKVHEEMITASDSFYTYEIGQNYVILPSITQWKINDYIETNNAKLVQPGFTYNSGTNPQRLTVQELRDMIAEHLEPNFVA
jgi:FlaA1/EpsC-like NDP-sugar epimerase